MKIDPKYSIEIRDGKPVIVNLSGVPVPDDEPLILFRARDQHALAAILYYQMQCVKGGCTPFHMRGIQNRVDAFKTFRNAHPERMKQPGITEEMTEYLIAPRSDSPVGRLNLGAGNPPVVERLCRDCSRRIVLFPAGVEYANRTQRPLICDKCARKKGLFHD